MLLTIVAELRTVSWEDSQSKIGTYPAHERYSLNRLAQTHLVRQDAVVAHSPVVCKPI